jgi:hypothetical protein
MLSGSRCARGGRAASAATSAAGAASRLQIVDCDMVQQMEGARKVDETGRVTEETERTVRPASGIPGAKSRVPRLFASVLDLPALQN